MVELTIPMEMGTKNAGAMKQIRNAEQVDSGTQDVQLNIDHPTTLI